ncbi:MAG: TIGR03016 family PEP-CTERM system-associated outer membrane protein, partial [Nitrosospira sp.]|nr:TIGR03016 family PEP-CTERM system-associated outer membrane protein [Nitrosospira sp.]
MAGNNPAMGGGTMGAGWRVLPRLSLVETYSDNVRLQQNGQQDLGTQINPGLIVNGVGRRYTVNIDYTMNNLIYANLSNFNRIRHQLNAMGTAELVEDFFFVDGRAIITQQNANLFGAQGINNVNVTGNRADVHIYNISPYIRHRFQDLATTALRSTRNIVSS